MISWLLKSKNLYLCFAFLFLFPDTINPIFTVFPRPEVLSRSQIENFVRMARDYEVNRQYSFLKIKKIIF